jgi:sugar phosphate isomerase/epimerase
LRHNHGPASQDRATPVNKNMRIGYNTNGMAHHRLEDAIAILADIGYESIALTVDQHALNPYADEFESQLDRVAGLLNQHNLACVIETGSRFILDPKRKHWPTLIDDSPGDRARRRGFLCRAVEIGAKLKADAVSLWSGAAPANQDHDTLMARLVDECRLILDVAESQDVRLAFEPEPCMFIDTMDKFAELHERVDHPLFGLTLDIGHVHCLDDGNINEHIGLWQHCLFNIHIEDMKRNVHEHLMFGEGEIDFPPILMVLRMIRYPFGLHVELPRHGYNAVEIARQAIAFLSVQM